ncbi:aspartate--ammonia ligase [Candidatus Woesearchaeota archaeon]|nr:aspartate--ammonia ligase [Candidatus Woesearchaeota archaeon]
MPKNQIIPEGYKSILTLRQTEKAIKEIKDFFEKKLSGELNLQRVSAPRFVRRGTGVNDDLNGTEKKVAFQVKYDRSIMAECVFSLAKWKRMALADYGFSVGEGLYTDMDAIRPDEEVLDNLHSIYVDQWDWEKSILPRDRNLEFLKKTVNSIYNSILETEKMIYEKYPVLKNRLPREITFVHSEDMVQKYPKLSPFERERELTKEYGAVFLIGIGGVLADGKPHDGRAPDYDDWSTPTNDGYRGLNGDIIVWNHLLDRQFELSSMGIRVDKEAMIRQLEIQGLAERKWYEWHKRLLGGEFPESIGGGLGQSRLCQLLLQKAHIGEVQASIWPEDVISYCREHDIHLL